MRNVQMEGGSHFVHDDVGPHAEVGAEHVDEACTEDLRAVQNDYLEQGSRR